jgi:hypothetical protein
MPRLNIPTLAVQVTREIIDHAVPRNSHHCMIADAVKESYPDAKYILVDLQSIRFSNLVLGRRYIYLTPAKAQHALLRFDQGKVVKPFRFTLGRPQSAGVKAVGWRANHPNTTPRTGTKYGITGVKTYRPRKEREFGVRVLEK